MSLPLVYVETSVISYLSSRPSRNVLTAARQTWTRDWWEVAGLYWSLAISELVLEEAGRGDPSAARRRLDALHGLPLLPATEEAQEYAGQLIALGAVPASEPEDALHIALATLGGARYLVSWNFAHLVGPDAKQKLLDAIRASGHTPAMLTTPEELLETLP
ncbi:MAG: type II toxin-antitoxin system VapC family toxin [Rhodocyclaceae bacterium]|nr:type II toxin-antitoxin system VapC family toxin [Rhodocyclaceae bacterium]